MNLSNRGAHPQRLMCLMSWKEVRVLCHWLCRRVSGNQANLNIFMEEGWEKGWWVKEARTGENSVCMAFVFCFVFLNLFDSHIHTPLWEVDERLSIISPEIFVYMFENEKKILVTD